MKKTICAFVFSFFLCLSLLSPVQASVDSAKLYSKYAYVYDITSGQTLMNKKANARIYPASMTKMMTVYTAIRLITNLNAKVKITNADIKDQYALDASSAFLKNKQVVTYKDLLYGAMYPSGADACWALARSLCGSEAAFVKEMNKDAKRIGMKNTHFNTSTGLPDKTHYTTCVDIAKLMAKAYTNATWRSVFTSKNASNAYYRPKGGNQLWMSTLTRMRVHQHIVANPAIMGAKSGYTKDAMYCLGSLAMVHGHLIATVTGKGIPTAFGPKKVTLACALVDHNTLIKDLVDHYKSLTLYSRGQKVKTFKIHFGVVDTYTYKMSESYKILVDSSFDESSLKTTFTGKSTIEAPLKKGQKLGTLRVSANGQTLAKATIYSGSEVAFSKQKYAIYIGIYVICGFAVFWVVFRNIRRHILKKKYAKRKAQRNRKKA